jgi:hypothetical protein
MIHFSLSPERGGCDSKARMPAEGRIAAERK